MKKLVPEGIAGRVPYKGTVLEVVYQLLGGLRSGMGYCGANCIETLHNAKFTRITNAGVLESTRTTSRSRARRPTIRVTNNQYNIDTGSVTGEGFPTWQSLDSHYYI